MAETIALSILALSFLLFVYTYFGYPALLWLAGKVAGRAVAPVVDEGGEWPRVSITVPAYNEEAQIGELIKSLLALDYPKDRLQLLIVSDASSDRTDDIVREYADSGIELLRMPERGGKTKAENAAARHLEGDIVVNTDASTRILPDALKPLVSVFRDPSIGCASGRDVSVDPDGPTGNVGESGYVGYEMAIRELETRVSGIVGASGCFYAIRPELHRLPLPEALSRDFASAMHAVEKGYRAVSVSEAVCLVPRSRSLKREYRRKVRTITRGMETLWHKRALMNPFRTGLFAWMLFSHKVCRWALPWAAFASFVAVGVLALGHEWARVLFAGGVVVLGLGAVGWLRSERPGVSPVFTLPAFVLAGNAAAAHALLRALVGDRDAMWEPTRRSVVKSPGSS